METVLESLSKDELIALLEQQHSALAERDEKICYLQSQVEMYRRMQFGQKRERFEGDPAQMSLPFVAPVAEVEQQQGILPIKYRYNFPIIMLKVSWIMVYGGMV